MTEKQGELVSRKEVDAAMSQATREVREFLVETAQRITEKLAGIVDDVTEDQRRQWMKILRRELLASMENMARKYDAERTESPG
ncbi:hypothetical protein [Synechococcus sp. CBW1107]|uniref:hypothetical protein n=1 Tax=Synechococcus sp. CBW1107 TaxID=2789857 RepID=UPI002AD42D94|nr:hypothetical protein [Synechococcus sp. CBW1107]